MMRKIILRCRQSNRTDHQDYSRRFADGSKGGRIGKGTIHRRKIAEVGLYTIFYNSDCVRDLATLLESLVSRCNKEFLKIVPIVIGGRNHLQNGILLIFEQGEICSITLRFHFFDGNKPKRRRINAVSEPSVRRRSVREHMA